MSFEDHSILYGHNKETSRPASEIKRTREKREKNKSWIEGNNRIHKVRERERGRKENAN